MRFHHFIVFFKHVFNSVYDCCRLDTTEGGRLARGLQQFEFLNEKNLVCNYLISYFLKQSW